MGPFFFYFNLFFLSFIHIHTQAHASEAVLKELKFMTKTNILIKVHGEVKKSELKVDLDVGKKSIQSIQFSAHPDNMTTFMGIRDEHMKKHIFTDSTGKLIAVDFKTTAQSPACVLNQEKGTCSVIGTLSIRGQSKEMTLPLNYEKESDHYVLSFEKDILLSDYKIERPSNGPAKTDDVVKITGISEVKF